MQVTQQFSLAKNEANLVYGKYKGEGYALNYLVERAGGSVIPNVSVEEAFALGGLDWEPVKRPGAYMGACGPEPTDKYCSIVRSDTDELLGIHGPGWTPTLNSEIRHLFEYLREDVRIENILQINGGARLYITASIQAEADITEGDSVRRYLHVHNSHDGLTGYGVSFSDVRPFCANQMYRILSKGTSKNEVSLKHRHTSSVRDFAQALPELIDVRKRQFTETIETYKQMAKKRVTKALFADTLTELYADKLAKPMRLKVVDPNTTKGIETTRPRELTDLKEYEYIHANFFEDRAYGFQDSKAKGTVWHLYNAITQHETHTSGRDGTSDDVARIRLEKLYNGASGNRINHAHEICAKLCTV